MGHAAAAAALPATFPAVVDDAAARFGDRVFLEDGAVRLTFLDLARAARGATAALMALGVERGDRVAIWAPNGARWVVAALGAHGAGAAIVPLNTRYKGGEAAEILERSGARVLVATSSFLGVDGVAALREACGGAGTCGPVAGLDALRAVVVVEGEVPEGCVGWEAFLAGGACIQAADVEARWTSVAPGDDADVLFTSGTTGRAKGVRTAHGQNVRAFRAWSEVTGLGPEDRYLIVNPFFHAFGTKAGWFACLLTGATALPHRVFDAAAVLARVRAEGVTVLPGPPTLYQSILALPDRDPEATRSLRLAVTGAAVVPTELVLRMRGELGFETVITGYGLTETCGIVAMCRHDDDPETIARTSGRAIEGVEMRAVDPEGRPVPAGAPGEIVVRGYNVMQGYLDDPEATAAAIDRDGFLHTGDIGILDARGYVRITDRLKDMFICGGFNAYPAEIERLLLQDERVAQAAVIGVPDPRLGEVGMAFVVPRAGAVVDEAEIIARARTAMANYKVPRQVRVVDALPLNAMGKVTKEVLRAWARDGERGDGE